MDTDDIKEQYFDWLNQHNLNEPVSCLTAWMEAYQRGLAERGLTNDRSEDNRAGNGKAL